MGEHRLLCPSAQPNLSDSIVFAVVAGTEDAPEAVFLPTPLPVAPELLQMCKPVQPTEVLRFAAPCQGSKCQHFTGAKCRLVDNLVNILERPGQDLKPCAIRLNCRWFAQQGRAACDRCTEIVTSYYHPPTDLDVASRPPVPDQE